MATETKKKGLIYRLGYAFGWFSGRYRRLEEPVLRWAMKKGMPATLASLLSGLVRLSLIGLFLYLAFWVVVVIFGVYIVKEMVNYEIDSSEDEGKFDDIDFCPDRFSPEYIHDPRFDHKP
ncbi:DUF3742 family protein [Pseudomonas sp. RHF3.3-3]|uniref:DUF3742 family protein n=1 Tax=Pseudomonas sp. RHF3.3-3 TaxID=3396624 RepID=UPI003A86903A